MKTTIKYTRQGVQLCLNLVIGIVILASLAFEKIVPVGDLHDRDGERVGVQFAGSPGGDQRSRRRCRRWQNHGASGAERRLRNQ